MINVRAISPETFAGLREEWNALLARSRRSAPMLAWEWVYSWWEAYRQAGVERELGLLGIRDVGGKLIGLAPFVKRPWSAFGLTLQRLEFMGTGEREQDETCSEFLDVIAEQGREAEVSDAVAAHLLADHTWEEMVCRDVPSDGPTVMGLVKNALAASGGVHVEEFGAARCPYIRLPETWEAYLATLSRNSRRLVRYKRKQLEAVGGAQFRSAETPEDIRAAFPEFARLHQQRWSNDDRPGCFGSAVFADFLARLTPRLAERGDVRMATLAMGGETVAVYYLLCRGGAVYYYNSGVALQAHGELSPGAVCLGYVIEDAIRRGEKEFHFLKGNANSYKWHWTDQAVPVISTLVRREGWKRTIRAAAERLERGAKTLKRRLRAPPAAADET